MRVLLYAKMLKENETEETIVSFMRFLSLIAFQLGGARSPWASPLATPMPPETNFAPGLDKINRTCIVSSILLSQLSPPPS